MTTTVAASQTNEKLITKTYRRGSDRAVPVEATLSRARPLMPRLGITRIANITGLDMIGVPVVAVHRPNSRSLSVAQGKGASLPAAQASGLMESIETYHAEHVDKPLYFRSIRESADRNDVVDLRGLSRVKNATYNLDLPILWIAGRDLLANEGRLVPYELVHLDFRTPLPPGSGIFLMSSNGLASGNNHFEALSHAICELVERDANTLFACEDAGRTGNRRLNLATVNDPLCKEVLDKFENAGVDALVHETTSDIGICSYMCTIVDRESLVDSTMPVAGSGCHPRRGIALLRALTEAAQGRLTDISGSRDDLTAPIRYDATRAARKCAVIRELIANTPAHRTFGDAPDMDHASFNEDLTWELQQLASAGLREVVAVDLTKPDIGVPVVRVIIPYLESMHEVEGYSPGPRALKLLRAKEASRS